MNLNLTLKRKQIAFNIASFNLRKMTTGKVSINIQSIEVDNFVFKKPPENMHPSFNISKLTPFLEVQIRHNIDKQLFTLICHFEYIYDVDSKSELDIVNFSTRFNFHIDNLNEILKIKDSTFSIPDSLMNTLVDTAISTTRGMLIERTSGTFISSFYFPMVDTERFLSSLKTDA